MRKTIAGRPYAEIENLLEDLPGNPIDIPANTSPASVQRVICTAVAHTNYLLAAILIELREIKEQLL